MYLTQSVIAEDHFIRQRVAACAAQEGCMDVGIDADGWMIEWRREWSAAPGWDAAWESALANNVVDIGKDPTVITDGMILGQVQSMMPFQKLEDNLPV